MLCWSLMLGNIGIMSARWHYADATMPAWQPERRQTAVGGRRSWAPATVLLEALTVKCKIKFWVNHPQNRIRWGKHWPSVFSLHWPNVHCLTLTLGQCIFGNWSNVILQTLVQRRLRRHWPNVCKATLGQWLFGNGSNVASQILVQRRLTGVGPTSVKRRCKGQCIFGNGSNVTLQTLG